MTDVSAYIDVDNTVKFAVVMTASSQKSWWYPDLTAGQVGQNLAANKAVLTDVSAYIDVDNTVKFAVVMTASSQKSWWYPDLTADPDAVQQQLKANRAVLTAVSAYIDLDNTLKFAVVMTASNQQQWWWYTGFDSGEITGQVSNLKARVALLAPHLPPMSGALRAAFISPDLYLGLTVSPDGVNWPTGFPGVGSTSSPYVSIGEPGQQPNAFGAPSLAYFGGAYWMAYVNVQPDTPAIWVASSADGISWSGWTAVTPNDPGALTHPVTAPSTAVFNGQLWLGFLEGPVYSPTASGVFPPAHTGRICVCSSSDCATWSATAQIAFPDPFELPADPLESSQPLPADDHVSVSAPALASFAGQLWLAFVDAVLTPTPGFGLTLQGPGRVMICSSADGITWSAASPVTDGPVTQSAVSLASFNGRLWMALVADHGTPSQPGSNQLLVCSSPDGQTWSPPAPVPGQTGQAAPSLTAFAYKLWLAYVGNDPSVQLLACSSPNGQRWSPAVPVHQSTSANEALYAVEGLLTPYMGVGLCGTAEGQVSPLYKVLSVVYAPPGRSSGSISTVTYGSDSATNTTTLVSNSFKQGVSVSVSVADVASSDFSFSTTTKHASSFTTVVDWQSNFTASGPAADGIDHGYDQFCLWLNPSFDVTADLAGNLGLRLGTQNGDPVDTQWVYARWLQKPQTMPAGLAKTLAERGLTDADFKNILACNPFTDPKSGPSPGTLAARYAQVANAPYEPPLTPVDPPNQQGYTFTTSSVNTTDDSAETSYSVGLSVSPGIGDIFQATVAASFEWTDTTEDTSTATSTQNSVGRDHRPDLCLQRHHGPRGLLGPDLPHVHVRLRRGLAHRLRVASPSSTTLSAREAGRCFIYLF